MSTLFLNSPWLRRFEHPLNSMVVDVVDVRPNTFMISGTRKATVELAGKIEFDIVSPSSDGNPNVDHWETSASPTRIPRELIDNGFRPERLSVALPPKKFLTELENRWDWCLNYLVPAEPEDEDWPVVYVPASPIYAKHKRKQFVLYVLKDLSGLYADVDDSAKWAVDDHLISQLRTRGTSAKIGFMRDSGSAANEWLVTVSALVSTSGAVKIWLPTQSLLKRFTKTDPLFIARLNIEAERPYCKDPLLWPDVKETLQEFATEFRTNYPEIDEYMGSGTKLKDLPVEYHASFSQFQRRLRLLSHDGFSDFSRNEKGE